ncbi:MAG TPA: alanyl-tRNA editing protein [Bryobacteraceae bacterium]|jgi:alanyl-tRNA synthetase
MTERLYYSDCYLSEFRARVVEADAGRTRVYLDRTAFYPTSGGQPFDMGTLGGVPVIEVVDEEDRVAHVLEVALEAGEVTGHVDWARRFDHMQQHTGQHLLSAVFEELYQMRTLSFHMGAETSTIELGAPSLSTAQIERVEERCAQIVAEARPVIVTFEDAESAAGLRKESQRSGTLRIVAIEGLDRSACGGTHVRTTAEIGLVLTRKLDKVRNNVRIEFVCGRRALAQARTDYRVLAAVGRALSAPFEKAPEMIAAQAERVKGLEKSVQKLATELAVREGRELFAATEADAEGIRRVTQRGAIDEAMRARAQAFLVGGKAVFLAVSAEPPSVLLAASGDSGVHAGDRVKAAVSAAGGRGGGNANLAQGSVPDAATLAAVEEAISRPPGT